MKRAAAALAASCALLGAAPAPVALDLLLADTPAPKLSDYRLIDETGAPNARVTRYALNTPLWSDGADKDRYVFMPPAKAAAYRADGVMEFPVGTALVKTFRDGTRKLETRLLIRREAGWAALPYVWNVDGTEATLKRTGAVLTRADGSAWEVPNANQCKGCHAAGQSIVPIGPKAWNLGPARIKQWAAVGILTGVPKILPQVPAWDDAKAPVAIRAQAYLDVNCAHCHNPVGPASNSGLSLGLAETDPTAKGLWKHPVAAGRGTGGRHVSIVPGKPDDSILVYRMETTEPGVMMPELGRTRTHAEGVALVRAYVAGLK
jgi:uncharacterized repeat protein (TIGR03806 family)